MKSIEVTAKTVEEAIEKAIQELKTTKENLEVEVIEKGSKGFLNILGVKEAKIRATLKKDCKDDAKRFLEDIMRIMNVEADVLLEEDHGNLSIDLKGKDMGILIGYRGETLDALQYLTSLIVNKGEDYKRVILDTNNYRSKRAEILKELAIKKANKVKAYNKSIKLEPMNPYERRIIHSALQDDECIRTYSEGEEPYRRVVIDLKKKKA